MLYNIRESQVDSQGCQYIWGMLEEPKFNEQGLWHGIKSFDIHLNHRKQKTVISVFDWINGVACNFKTIKRIDNEIIDITEVEQVLNQCGIIKAE